MIASMRMMFGLFSAFSAPICYSLIADYFPPAKRTLANACFTAASFFGIAFATLSNILVGSLGWRFTYFVCGTYGLIAIVFVIIFVKEPERGRFDPKKESVLRESREDAELESDIATENDENLSDTGTPKAVPKKPNVCLAILNSISLGLKTLILNPCTRWLVLGNLILNISQYLFSYSLTKYFNFYNQESMFSYLNAICIIFGGCTSCLVSGAMANKLDAKSYRAKSYVSSAMCLLAVPLCLILFLVQSSFAFSCVTLFLYDLLCLGYYAPVMSMI